MRIKKAGILIIAAAITCTTPAVPAMAADTSESVQEIISDNEIDFGKNRNGLLAIAIKVPRRQV